MALDSVSINNVVGSIIDILTIVLIGWAAWDALVNRSINAALKRGFTAIAIWTIFRTMTSYLFPEASDVIPASNPQEFYNMAIGPINSAITPAVTVGMGNQNPGINVVTKGLAMSTAIWNSILSFKLLALPIAWCTLMWAIEIAKGGSWLNVGMKVVMWTILFLIAAGPVTAQLPMLILNTASQMMSTVTKSVSNAQPVAGPSIPTWDATNLNLARNNAQPPAGLDALVAPYIGSCNRAITTASTLSQLKQCNYIGEAATSIVSALIYNDPTGEATDPKSALQLATPQMNSYNMLYVNTNPSQWIQNHFITPDGTIQNGAGNTAGFIKLGSAADPTTAVATAYTTALSASKAQLTANIKVLIQQGASPTDIALKNNYLSQLSSYSAPTLVPVSTSDGLTTIRNFITNYYSTMDPTKINAIITNVDSTNKDAWGVLWFTPAGQQALKTNLGSSSLAGWNASTPFTSWSSSTNIQNAIVRDESGAATPSHDFSIMHLWDAIRGLIVLFFIALAESGMALVVLVLKILVYTLAPIITYFGIYALCLGVFVLSLSYPLAAFWSLFDRWSVLLDWTKGAFWVMSWAPIVAVGIYMCSFDSSDLVAAALAVLKALPGIGAMTAVGGAAVNNAAGSPMGTGMITDSFVSTCAGILMILASPLVANLIFNPGLAGISSLTSTLVKSVGSLAVGAAAAPVAAAAGAAAVGVKAAASGVGATVLKGMESLNRAGSALGGAGGATAVAGGVASVSREGALSRVQAALGGGSTPGGRAVGAVGDAMSSLGNMEKKDWAAGVGASATGALRKLASRAGAPDSTARRAAEFMADVAGSGVTGVATAASAFARTTTTQGRQQAAGVRAMLNPTGITPISARASQATAAAASGDLLGAMGLAQGKGEHLADWEYGGAPRSPTAGRGGAGGAGGGRAEGSGGPLTSAALGESPAQGSVAPGLAGTGAGFPVTAAAQSRAAATEARARFASGEAAPPEARAAHVAKAHQLAAGAVMSHAAGNFPEAVGKSLEALDHAIDSGNAGLTAQASQMYTRMSAAESDSMAEQGAPPLQRSHADGLARGALSVARDRMVSSARSSGQHIPAAPRVTPATDTAEREASRTRASAALEQARQQDIGYTSTGTKMATARSAIVQAVRSGDPTLVSAAREVAVTAAFAVSSMDANDPERPAALHDAAYALSAIEPYEPESPSPATSGANSGPSSIGSGASGLSSEAGAEYRAVLGQARNGNALIEHARRPEAPLVRSTAANSVRALSIARFGNSAGQIAESGEYIQRCAAAALRMDAGDEETPMAQIEVAEAMVHASDGFTQAAGLHESYSAELMEAASHEESGDHRTSLVQQAETHGQRSEQMRTHAATSRVTARSVAQSAMSSARVSVAMGGGETRVAQLNQVNARAAQLFIQRPPAIDEAGSDQGPHTAPLLAEHDGILADATPVGLPPDLPSDPPPLG